VVGIALVGGKPFAWINILVELDAPKFRAHAPPLLDSEEDQYMPKTVPVAGIVFPSSPFG
jgi:hypothetical protein